MSIHKYKECDGCGDKQEIDAENWDTMNHDGWSEVYLGNPKARHYCSMFCLKQAISHLEEKGRDAE